LATTEQHVEGGSPNMESIELSERIEILRAIDNMALGKSKALS
jgi:hypothetical protein